MKNWPRWRNLIWATASQSHRICVADSTSWHLSQMGSLISPNLKRCPFRWQCPVSSPTTHPDTVRMECLRSELRPFSHQVFPWLMLLRLFRHYRQSAFPGHGDRSAPSLNTCYRPWSPRMTSSMTRSPSLSSLILSTHSRKNVATLSLRESKSTRILCVY
jgi:hypothetical protein